MHALHQRIQMGLVNAQKNGGRSADIRVEIFFLHRVVQSPHDRAEGVVDFCPNKARLPNFKIQLHPVAALCGGVFQDHIVVVKHLDGVAFF